MKRSSNWMSAFALMVAFSLIPIACAFPVQGTRPPAEPTMGPDTPASSTPILPTPTPPAQVGSNPGDTNPRDLYPRDVISTSRLFTFLERLTSIQPYSGWRNSATQGEREAQDYVEQELRKMEFLSGSGLQIERQTFRVVLATELWETRLVLHRYGQGIEIPVSGIRGSRDSLDLALGFDSDGAPNDEVRNPVEIEGGISLVRTQADMDNLSPASVADRQIFAGYTLFDRIIQGDTAYRNANRLVELAPAGIILVTEFSNRSRESHGTYVGEGGIFAQVPNPRRLPVMYVRLEDIASAGIAGWDGLAEVDQSTLRWDADVFSPGTSGNLHAVLPGSDSSRALILTAHIDSANNPGAMDDGSGSAVLLETAAALNEARVLPPVDLHLVWFGSEELGLFGSGHFANTHQDLLDKAVAMLGFDCMTRPIEGLSPAFSLITWPPTAIGDQTDPWSLKLQLAAADEGIALTPMNLYSIASDNSSFAGFDVPNADVIYQQEPQMEQLGGVWFAGHIHDPYDTVDLVREVSAPFTEMVEVALSAIYDTGLQQESFRVTPKPAHRLLFIASHTEPVHMTPAALMAFGMEMSNQGFDVDVIPYGQAVTPADLEGVDLAVALPVVDYPFQEAGPSPYDEAWTAQEIDVLTGYVDQGGLLVIANSGRRLKYVNLIYEPNEDWPDVNALAGEFGVEFVSGVLQTNYHTENGSPLMDGVSNLESPEANPVPFEMETGEVLVSSGENPAIALVTPESSAGQVLVLSDLGFLGSGFRGPVNARFWQNLAEFARSR